MKTVILCGGYGTRIRDVAQDIPKPMIQVGEFPILWHIMKHYAHYGHKDFVLCLGYKSEVIKDYFLNYKSRKADFTLNLSTQETVEHGAAHIEDWRITFAETGLNSYTGARLYRVKKYLQDEEYFALTYGDGVGNIDIHKLVEFHKSHGKLVTVTAAHPPGRFGELDIEGNQVIGFNEKPQSVDGWISAGFFVCNRKMLDYLTEDETLILERAPLESIVKDGQMMVYQHKDFWHPMDTARDYQLLNELWSVGKAPWKVW